MGAKEGVIGEKGRVTAFGIDWSFAYPDEKNRLGQVGFDVLFEAVIRPSWNACGESGHYSIRPEIATYKRFEPYRIQACGRRRDNKKYRLEKVISL